MRVETPEDLERVAALLAESDFGRGDARWEEGGAVFRIHTFRPPEEARKPAGLFRKGQRDWIPCVLTFRGVREVHLEKEFDAPAGERLLEVRRQGEGFRIEIASAQGVRLGLVVDRLDVDLD